MEDNQCPYCKHELFLHVDPPTFYHGDYGYQWRECSNCGFREPKRRAVQAGNASVKSYSMTAKDAFKKIQSKQVWDDDRFPKPGHRDEPDAE